MHQQFWRAESESMPMVPIPCRDSFESDELARIRAGHVPRSQDEKWFVLYERPYLLLYRSWTGCLVYRLQLDERADGGAVVSAAVLDNPKLYRRGPSEYEATFASVLVRRLLLDQDVPFPEGAD